MHCYFGAFKSVHLVKNFLLIHIMYYCNYESSTCKTKRFNTICTVINFM